MKELKLEAEQIKIVLESLTELKINSYVAQRKQLIELEVNKSISVEAYQAYVRYIDNLVELIDNTHESILNKLKY